MNTAATPKVGQVVRHHFLWSEEQAAGRTEAAKSRPCIIVAVEARPSADFPRVTVLPVTSQKPRPGTTAVAVPDSLKARVGFDAVRPAWVVIDEANVFTWPGYDLVPQPDGGFVHGTITSGFFQQIAAAVIRVRSSSLVRRTDRDDA